MLDLISIGGATRDIFFEFTHLKPEKPKNHMDGEFLNIPYGDKLVSENTFYSYGGGAVNVAVCGARLGLKTGSVCNIGREGTGSILKEFLRDEGVNTGLVSRDVSLHTGLSILIVGSDGEHTGFLERGANNHLYLKKPSALKKTKWFYISSLTGESEKILPQLFGLAEKAGIKIAFNPGSRQLAGGYHELKKYIAQSEVLLLNLEEAEGLVFSKTKRPPKNEKEVLKSLEEMGPKISVVTDAARGSHAICGGKTYSERAFCAHPVDTTGAGDSFGGTFVFGIIKGYPVQQALQLASKNAASVVENMGATKGLLNYNDLKG